ncbi:elongation factor G [Candidatus Poribacteria bacterium]|jgi:elongation factor G|nr:elongation factor G [Candidatus Poribacteria bacterium]MBT5534092.1 elongation factor G [Candidatus Poribacteria bacterium]MBT5714758.1 elongation factor G [Candidatus Poribacteria bacterium]MBT7095961.1 elongation factor G [Candidatus Poribacteria bacterium]MBT7809542.1 elongation factor G [Candidatus Poribacteria bacterium]
MKQYPTDAIRNIAAVAHADVGKTSLIEAMLYHAGAIHKMGSVNEGDTVSDYDPDEVERKTTLAVTPCVAEWKDHKLNLLDTPGYEDFYGEVESALRVVEGALVLIDGERGVEGGTEKVWALVKKYEKPCAIVVNRMDGEQAESQKALATVEEILETTALPLNLPIGSGQALEGVVDLLTMRALTYGADGKTVTEGDIPDDLAGLAEEAREALVEAAAESDEELLDKYFEDGELSDDEVARGLKAGIREGLIVPALHTAAEKGIGVSAVLDFITSCFPSPADVPVTAAVNGEETEIEADADGPLAAFVYKTIFDPYAGRLSLFRVYSGSLGVEHVQNTTRAASERVGKVVHRQGGQDVDASVIVAGDFGAVAKLADTATGDTLARADAPIHLPPVEFPRPAYSRAVFPEKDGDDDRLSTALSRLAEEDPTLHVTRNNETDQTLLEGLGDQHLTMALAKAKRKFNASARLDLPKIAYRETITKTVKEVDYTHRKQTGGAGQYAKVVITMEPTARGDGYEFVDKIFGGAIDQQFRPSVDKGVKQAMADGVIAGYPMVDFRVTLVDGKTHPVDSKDIAFQTAGRGAFREAAAKAGAVLLEPIMTVSILVPEEMMGDVIGDMNSRRGRVMGMEQVGRRQVIQATVPLAEMSRYQTDLKSMTSARGSYTMELSHYEAVPGDVQEKIVAMNEDVEE